MKITYKMKNLFFSVAMMFAFASVTSANTNTINNTSNFKIDDIGPTITISIDFGRVSKDCKGFGVCDVDIEIKIELSVRPNGGSGTAQIGKDGKLSVAFVKETMTEETIANYFSNSTFVVEEDFQLPSDVSEQLGTKNYFIKAGKYKVVETKEGYSVKF